MTDITSVSLVKYGKTNTPHIIITDTPDVCVICLGERETESHHLIPSRCSAKHNILKHLRARVCHDCHGMLHAENKELDGFSIIKRQAHMLNKYKSDFKELKEKNWSWLILELKEKEAQMIKLLKKGIQKRKDDGEFKDIYPFQKYMEGRLKENKRIRASLAKHISSNKHMLSSKGGTEVK